MNSRRILRFTCKQTQQNDWLLRLVEQARCFVDGLLISRSHRQVTRLRQDFTFRNFRHDVLGKADEGRARPTCPGNAKRVRQNLSRRLRRVDLGAELRYRLADTH